MSISVVICAAGKGSRAGFEKNKLLVSFNGECVLTKTLDKFLSIADEIVLAISKTDEQEIKELLVHYPTAKTVIGGDTRFESVYNALQAVTGEIVLIHDGARPFVSEEIILDCIQSVKEYGSGICSIPVTDTVAIKSKDDTIQSVPDRNTLVRIQTPQGFYLKDIARAYAIAKTTNTEKIYTDDSSVYADFISPPKLCDGSEENIKMTFARDFTPTTRVGFGVDTHAFGKEQNYITLCGVQVPSESGLIAHSDGDVAVHALMDGMLSAAGLKDIGYYFPDTDEKWKGANSMQMLLSVKELIATEGYQAKNVSIAIQAEKPRLAKYIDQMKTEIATALDLECSAVGITAGTNEKLGYVGEGKGITVYAYVLLTNK